MEKPNRRRTDRVPTLRNDEPSLTSAVARRAYELYLARGGNHGHNVDDDWLQAERELQEAARSAAV
jgi:hypothetical protein